MRWLHNLVGVAAVFGLMAVSSVSWAGGVIVVDDLSVAFTPNPILIAGPGSIDTSNSQTGAGILGTRKGVVRNFDNDSGNITLQVDPGVQSLSVGSVSQDFASAFLNYDFTSLSGGFLDLTGLSKIALTYQHVDAQGTEIELFARLTSVGGFMDFELDLLEDGDTQSYFLLANFTGVDLSRITSLQFRFDLTTDQDLQLQSDSDIRILEDTPEPSSLLLWGSVALVAGWFTRRKLMKSAA